MRLFPAAIAAGLLLIPTVVSAQKDPPKAKTVSFPADHPLISILIPDGWTAPGAGIAKTSLNVVPPKPVDGKVGLSVKENVTDPRMVFTKTLDEMEVKGAKWDSKGEEFALNGMKGFTAKGSATKNGETWRLSELILSPDGKHYCSISIQFKQGDLASIGPALEALMNSIQPLKAPAK